MTKQEWNRLKQFTRFKSDDNRWRPISEANKGKRIIKGKAKAVGQWLKSSRILPMTKI
jgi:hypothetical protein